MVLLISLERLSRSIKESFAGLNFLTSLENSSFIFFEVCLENPGVSERIPILEHFQEMVAAEALPLSVRSRISLSMYEEPEPSVKSSKVLFELLFNEAEGAFVVGGKGVV